MPLVRKRRKRSALRHYRWVLLLAGAAFVLLIGGSALAYFNEVDWFGAATEVEEATPVVADAPRPLTTGPEVARAASERVGTDKNREKLMGVRMYGKLTIGGRVYDLEILKRAPNQVRLQLSDTRERLILGTDGASAWMVRRLPSGIAQSWELDSEVGDWLWLLSAPGSWLLQPQGNGPQLVLESAPAADGAPQDAAAQPDSLPVAARSPSGREAVYYLDREQLLPRKLELRAPDGVPIWTATFEELRVQDGISVPRKVVARRSGLPDMVLQIERIQFNPGTLPQVFRKPTVDETFALATKPRPPGTISLAPPGTVADSTRPTDYTSLPANPGMTSRAVQRDLRNALAGPGMTVANGTADTSIFNPAPEGETSPPPLDGTSQNLLENYGFPWPLPW